MVHCGQRHSAGPRCLLIQPIKDNTVQMLSEKDKDSSRACWQMVASSTPFNTPLFYLLFTDFVTFTYFSKMPFWRFVRESKDVCSELHFSSQKSHFKDTNLNS